MGDPRDAVVLLCKCGKTHKTYGIRTENLVLVVEAEKTDEFGDLGAVASTMMLMPGSLYVSNRRVR